MNIGIAKVNEEIVNKCQEFLVLLSPEQINQIMQSDMFTAEQKKKFIEFAKLVIDKQKTKTFSDSSDC